MFNKTIQKLSKTIGWIIFLLSLLTFVFGVKFYSVNNFYLIIVLANIVFFITYALNNKTNNRNKSENRNNDF